MFVVDRFDITPGWSNRTLLINNLNKHHEISEKPKILQEPHSFLYGFASKAR